MVSYGVKTMPLIQRENPYRGVNAHLHSLLQATSGGWAQFHAPHIIHLAEWIERHLPAGYNAFPERSLSP
jgi:hypothetical protein